MNSCVSNLLVVSLIVLLTLRSTTYAEVDRHTQDTRAFASFNKQASPLLSKYCVDCHTGDDANGDVDLDVFQTKTSVLKGFEVWQKIDELLASKTMPPEDEPQPTEQEVASFRDWYRVNFVESVVARPATFRPRRLSATEYRNTLRSLFGFDLEVAVIEAEQTITEKSLVLKLLPTDPPGASGFRNDTSSNPLSTQIYEQYAYLTDYALEKLFSTTQRERLEQISGKLHDSEFSAGNAEKLVRYVVPRAWRRDIGHDMLEEIVARATEDSDCTASTKRELKAILMAPQFIYRGLLMERKPGEQQQVDEFELAERLSYFLWADMPDDELVGLARSGQLSSPDAYRSQIERMLDSPKAATLATDFVTQWLTLDEIEQVSDNPPFMVALKSQPTDFFQYLIADDRPLIELIDSRVTFANPLTRRFYTADAKQFGSYRRPNGIEIEIVPNKRITLTNTKGRGGILTMPGVLAMNRGPILRGVWMMERIMGEHLGDPPPDVGQVKAQIPGENQSFRERFAQHRENQSCAICHDKIDPLGFALEAYDDKGGFMSGSSGKRKGNKKASEHKEPIDASGQLPSGESFKDFDELKQILTTTQRDTIVRNIIEQTMRYAFCRRLEVYDQPIVDDILSKVRTDGTWRQLMFLVADSLPFRQTIVPAEPAIVSTSD